MAALVDIHSHILPAVDDGARSLETALEMLRRGAVEGIGVAVLTPHLHPEDGPPQEELHRERFAELQQAVQQAGLPIEIHLGAEIAFRFGLAEVARWPSGTLAGGGRFALVDLPPGPLSPGLEQGFFELRTSGFRPILAHPERQRNLARQPERIARLRQQEVLMQVDAGSLTGQFGTRAQRTAEGMVRRGWAEFVASDAHDLEKRPFSLAAARRRIEELGGPGEVRRLMVENPGRVVRGEGIEQRAGNAVGRRRRGLLRRLLGFKKSSQSS